MGTARLIGRGKNQKLLIDADEPGEYSVTRTDDENEPLKLEFKPKGKPSGQTSKEPAPEPRKKERSTFFDDDDE